MAYIVHGILQARILEWVAFPVSRESSQPRDWIQVSCNAGGFFTIWATREYFIEQCKILGSQCFPWKTKHTFFHCHLVSKVADEKSVGLWFCCLWNETSCHVWKPVSQSLYFQSLEIFLSVSLKICIVFNSEFFLFLTFLLLLVLFIYLFLKLCILHLESPGSILHISYSFHSFFFIFSAFV